MCVSGGCFSGQSSLKKRYVTIDGIKLHGVEVSFRRRLIEVFPRYISRRPIIPLFFRQSTTQ
jgi:hypothetical protein